ncbi:uncharacterized protein LOC125657509 [Ostrea edulis]|uniref:uncharacterized protein LOC125657509 n=1 Tax=Ostrea edulis TaxID=37623 RepID=UPI0024AF56B3|nr:uncharacterized protein LOC125657509 [Ostrea edulis]
MEFLKVLVVLFVVFQGSLSRSISSEDELRVIVGNLEKLVARLRQYVADSNMPGYSMRENGPVSQYTPELPAHIQELPVHTPELPVHTPELPVHTPELPAHTPELPVHTPELPVHSPELPVHSPELPVHSPELPVHSPELPVHSPELPAHTPKLPAHTPELPIPSTRPPPHTRGFHDNKQDPSSPTHERLYQMFGKVLEPYFGSFPSGPYTSKMSLTPRDIVTKLNAWYNKDNKLMFEEQTFYSVGKQLLGAHLQCAKTKLNQIVFYVLKDQARAMAADDRNMNTRVRAILESWITDTATVDKVSQKIVLAAHRHTYGEIMEYIRYFQFKDIMEFLANMKMLLWRTEQNKWSPVMFDEKLNQLLTNNGFVFKCPSMNDLWRFHQEIVSRFQEKLFETPTLTETEAWMRKVLPTYMSTDATPAITAILQAYKDYVKSTMLHFKQVENHVTTRNPTDITNFMSKFLSPYQLQYLQSIFEFLNTGNTSEMRKRQLGNENVRSNGI